MKTIILQLNTIIDHPLFERRMFWGLVGVLAVMISMYGFFLGKTVVSVVERRFAQAEIEQIGSNVSNLEAQYLSKSETINMTQALAYGFVESEKTVYAVRGREAKTFALRP